MIISLYGPDTFRRNRKFQKVMEAYRMKNPSALVEKFDLSPSVPGNGTDQEFSRLKEFAANQSIFTDKKMAILENVWSDSNTIRGRKASTIGGSASGGKKEEPNPSRVKDLKKFLESCVKSQDLTGLIIETKAPLAAFKFLLEKPAEHEEFEELTGQKLKTFVKKEAEELGLLLSSEALDFLANAFDSDAWGLETELEKLRWLKPGAPLSIEEVRAVGDYSESENLFQFTNSLNYPGSLRQKLYSLERLLFLGEEPAKIFNIFAAGRYLPPEMLSRAADYDVAVKSGKLDYDEVLLDLALN